MRADGAAGAHGACAVGRTGRLPARPGPAAARPLEPSASARAHGGGLGEIRGRPGDGLQLVDILVGRRPADGACGTGGGQARDAPKGAPELGFKAQRHTHPTRACAL